MEPDLHPDLRPLAFLLGRWQGDGNGHWPGAGGFRYEEEMTFEHVGDPFLLYSQRSWRLEDGEPLHFERGFLRPAGEGRVELTLAHPLGIVEVAEGPVREAVIDVSSTALALTSTGSPVTELRRRIEVRHDTMAYELRMAMREVPLTRHLKGELRRI
jgi:THAP4-like, heme-binding beta-barrel domain